MTDAVVTLGSIVLALVVGYVIGEAAALARWNAERRRLRKRLGFATVEDYRHRD